MKQGVGVAGLFLQCSSYPEFQIPSAVGQNMRTEMTCGEGCVCGECLKLCSRIK